MCGLLRQPQIEKGGVAAANAFVRGVTEIKSGLIFARGRPLTIRSQ
jgi:hypothetical protein